MKIAVITNIKHPVIKWTGFGVENFVYILINGLIKKGHDITLYASGDSIVPCKLVSIHPKSINFDSNIKEEFKFYYEDWLYINLYKNANNYDIIHSHDHNRGMLYSLLSKTPTISTFHDVWDINRSPIELLLKANEINNNHTFIAISKYQKKLLLSSKLKNVKHIYHGIDTKNIPFLPVTHDPSMIYLGRINKRKGVHITIQVVQQTNKLLKIFGFINQSIPEELVLQQEIEGFSKKNKLIQLYDTVFKDKKWEVLGSGKLFLFPIQWEEPFGLVMIEAMATGTPVVAFARGSVPEVIKDGETGFIVNPSDNDIRGNFIIKKTGVEGLCEAVERIYSMPEDQYRKMRKACREHVEKNFTVERMVDDYEKVYEEILNKKTS
jgi:glycosyltransferase involved in cell wall biosynthesis